MVNVLARILSGSNTPIFPGFNRLQNGVFMLTLDVTFFRPAADYYEAVDTLFDAVKQAAPAEGINGALLPREPELRYRAKRERESIPADDKTWAALQEAAAELNADLEL